MQGLVDESDSAFGGIDVLVNNAGLGGLKPVAEMSDGEWQSVLDVTLTGTFRMTRAALKVMMPRKRGVIVNNASVLGWRAQKGQAHYAAAKAGVMALTRCSALEAAEHGIRINAVAPSIAMHDFLRRSAPQDFLDQLASREAFGPRRRSVGGRQRHRLSGERLCFVYGRRGGGGVQSAGLIGATPHPARSASQPSPARGEGRQ